MDRVRVRVRARALLADDLFTGTDKSPLPRGVLSLHLPPSVGDLLVEALPILRSRELHIVVDGQAKRAMRIHRLLGDRDREGKGEGERRERGGGELKEGRTCRGVATSSSLWNSATKTCFSSSSALGRRDGLKWKQDLMRSMASLDAAEKTAKRHDGDDERQED